jgi:hypothetical protein
MLKKTFAAIVALVGVLAGVSVFTGPFAKTGPALISITVAALAVIMLVGTGFAALLTYRKKTVTTSLMVITGVGILILVAGAGVGYVIWHGRSSTSISGQETTCSASLLTKSWRLESVDDAAQNYEASFNPDTIIGKNIMRVTYDLHGLTIQPGDHEDESAIIFKQPQRPNNWFVVSLARYGMNGKDGSQTVDIPLRDFVSLPDAPSGSPGGEHLDLTKPLLPPISARFWHRGHFVVDIATLRLCSTQQ